MDIKAFLSGLAAQGGTGGTHPVTKPDFTLSYENKDITGDIAPYLISFVYTDYLEGNLMSCRSNLKMWTVAGCVAGIRSKAMRWH